LQQDLVNNPYLRNKISTSLAFSAAADQLLLFDTLHHMQQSFVVLAYLALTAITREVNIALF
jgi:hypothetical protein